MNMFLVTATLLLCIDAISSTATDQLTSPIQFPLRNIQHSINLEFNSSFQSNYTSTFHQYGQSDGYTLNLPRLNLQWTPNPYPGFIESQKVVAINLQDNGIYRISPGSFDSVPNVHYLDLSKNRLAFCDFFNYGSCIENLVTLVIEENQLPKDSLSREISSAGCFPRLQNLYLRKNHIRMLNFSLKNAFPQLESLYLSSNEIDTCAFVRDVPASLAHLYVENNRIFSINSAIVQNLKTLKLDGNSVKRVCNKRCNDASLKLLGTTKLEVLSMSSNKISEIEACAFRDSYSLTVLNLSGNEIEQIHPSTFVSLRALTHLHLDSNNLSEMPNLRGNWNLKTLSLRNNKVTTIRKEHFSSTKTLQTLMLGGNRIQSIQCNTFADLTWLQKLDLSNNQLESLPSRWMQSLTNLKYLDLRDNKFMYVHHLSLTHSISMDEIYLQNNKLVRSDIQAIRAILPYAQINLNVCNAPCY